MRGRNFSYKTFVLDKGFRLVQKPIEGKNLSEKELSLQLQRDAGFLLRRYQRVNTWTMLNVDPPEIRGDFLNSTATGQRDIFDGNRYRKIVAEFEKSVTDQFLLSYVLPTRSDKAHMARGKFDNFSDEEILKFATAGTVDLGTFMTAERSIMAARSRKPARLPISLKRAKLIGIPADIRKRAEILGESVRPLLQDLSKMGKELSRIGREQGLLQARSKRRARLPVSDIKRLRELSTRQRILLQRQKIIEDRIRSGRLLPPPKQKRLTR